MSQKRLHARVNGRVQGVGFRYYTESHALDLNLHGWVRNVDDGSVELVAEGPASALDNLVERLREGPALSRVDEVLLDWSEPRADLPMFHVRP